MDKRIELYNILNIKMTTELAKEILTILRKNKENFSENSNGIFFDLRDVSEETIKEINQSLEIH